MALTEKERLKKLSDAKTGEDFYDLYLQVFGEEFPILNLRNPNSTRPWQHVLEPLWGYILLAEKMSSNPEISEAYNFGPEVSSNKTVLELVEEFSKILKVKFEVEKNFNDLKESNLLNLVSEKAQNKLNWQPIWNFKKTIFKTATWYNKTINNKKEIKQFI